MFLSNISQVNPALNPRLYPVFPKRVDRPLVSHFVGRQPILDSAGHTFGYELLYRSGTENRSQFADSNVASATVMDAALAAGLDLLCGGKRAFINCTEELLLSREIDILPPEAVVLEILETVPVTAELIKVCEELKHAGYLIALDDYVLSPETEALLSIADIVKLEPQHTTHEHMRSMRRRCRGGVRFLAEKVETWDQLRSTSHIGCDLFQGYFFARPQVIEIRKLRPFSDSYLRLMRLLSAEHFDFGEVTEALKTEPSLCYQLLRYLNSSRFGFSKEVTSLSHAVALLGEQSFRKWLAVATLAVAGVHAYNELQQTALVRARFCELLAPIVGLKEEELFLIGLLSLFNVVLNISTEQLVSELALSSEVRFGLLGRTTVGGLCREIVTAYGHGDWDAVLTHSTKAGIDSSVLPELYLEGLSWAHNLSLS